MTNEEFKAWRKTLNYSQQEAAVALDISVTTVELYERGTRRGGDDRPVEIPKQTALACMALSLIEAAQTNSVFRLTSEVRRLATQACYLLSLPTQTFTAAKTIEHDTMHAFLRYQGEIPESEMSLIELLFPTTTLKEIRLMLNRASNADWTKAT